MKKHTWNKIYKIFRWHLRVILSGILFLSVAYAQPVAVDRIVAIVGDTVITDTELQQAILLAKESNQYNISELRNSVLNNLIDEKIQLELAAQNGLTVTNRQLQQLVAKIADDNSLTTQQLYAKLAESGISANSYRTQLRNSLLINHLQQQVLGSKIKLTEEEINDFKQHTTKEYHVVDILIKVADQANPLSRKHYEEFAYNLSAKLQHGEHLKQRVQRQDLGWLQLHELPSVFVPIVQKMHIQEYSSPIVAENGYHILQLVAMRNIDDTGQVMTDEDIRKLLFTRKFDQEVRAWLAKLRKQNFVKINNS